MKAIDLYSGVGGWSLGLRLCGIDVVKSFEWWPQAVNTSNKNLGTSHKPIDIRSLNFKDLPKEEKKKYLDSIEELKNKHRIEKPKILKIVEFLEVNAYRHFYYKFDNY